MLNSGKIMDKNFEIPNSNTCFYESVSTASGFSTSVLWTWSMNQSPWNWPLWRCWVNESGGLWRWGIGPVPSLGMHTALAPNTPILFPAPRKLCWHYLQTWLHTHKIWHDGSCFTHSLKPSNKTKVAGRAREQQTPSEKNENLTQVSLFHLGMINATHHGDRNRKQATPLKI